MFKGCCYFNDGTYSNTIALKTIEDALGYIRLQIATGKEARILDANDHTIIKIIGSHIFLPEICSSE